MLVGLVDAIVRADEGEERERRGVRRNGDVDEPGATAGVFLPAEPRVTGGCDFGDCERGETFGGENELGMLVAAVETLFNNQP